MEEGASTIVSDAAAGEREVGGEERSSEARL